MTNTSNPALSRLRWWMNRSRVAILIAAMVLGIILPTPAPSQTHSAASRATSLLWGESGELWDRAGRLSDFSFAGYREGADLPDNAGPADISVRDFGARGDGHTDDTEAFKQAIASPDAGVIAIPPGRYVMTDILRIERSGVVLRGAGPNETVLVFPKPLNEIAPSWSQTTGGRRTSMYSWSGGFIQVLGDFQSDPITTIAPGVTRGDQTLQVADASGLSVGERVELRVSETDGNALAEHLYANDPGDTSELNGRIQAAMVARITAIEGHQIQIDRPMRWDVQREWRGSVHRFDPTVTEVGIEGIRFEFPATPYEGHFTEVGWNAIAFGRVADCWVRDVAIAHADSGIFIGGRFCTIENVHYLSDREPDSDRDSTGHHGILLGGQDNLFIGFRFDTRFIHDITVSNGSAGNVIASGRGVDLCFDHHRRAPHSNLVTEVDIGEGSRMYRSGGGRGLGRHAAAYTTFWNIRSQKPVGWPPARFAPDRITIVGVVSDEPAVMDAEGRWFEPMDPQRLHPANLYEAMRRQRLAR